MVTKALSTWSLHRTLGNAKSVDAPGTGGPATGTVPPATGLPLLDLPAELRRHGYDAVQICHFHLPSRDPHYLRELRAALADANIALDALLIDDGDLSHPDHADRDEAWIGEWLDVAAALGATRARLCAGRAAPTPERIAESGKRLARLAAAHPEVRVITENWLGMMPDAAAVLGVLDAAGASVGLMIDLGNWTGADKIEQLAAIAPRAESCHAKCHFSGAGPDEADYRASLQVLVDAGYDGTLALIYDGPDDDEWTQLDREFAIVQDVFAHQVGAAG